MRASVANILPIATATFFVLIISLIGGPLAIENAYGHGISLCMAPTGGCALSKNNEQYSSAYSDNKLDMNDDGRGVLTITGTIKNKYYDHELRLVPYVSVDARPSNPFGSFELNDLLLSYYPLYNAHASWYFKTEYDNQPNIIVIKPREEIDYEIKAYPLKAGVYHVHSSFVFDYVNDGEYRYYQSVGRGETVTVVGSNMVTTGEVTQLILPFVIGAAAIPIMVLKARTVAKNEHSSSSGTVESRVRAGIRLYFAAKASIETAWLAGLLLWLFFAAYPAFYSLESRIASIIGMIALIAGIAVSGYIAAIAKPKKLQSIFSIGTAIASMVFYYLANVISFYAWINGGSFYYDLLPTSGVGFGYNQFDINYMVALAGFGVNAAVATISALTMSREKYSTKVVAGLAIGISIALVVLMRTVA